MSGIALIEGRSEKNGQQTVTPSSSVTLSLKKSKLKPGLAIGVSLVLMFISVVTMMATYDFAVGMLGVKRIFYQVHNKEMDIQRGAPSRQGLCPMLDSPRDCPCTTFYPYPTGFRQLCRNLIPIHRFLRKLRPTQNNTLQATQS